MLGFKGKGKSSMPCVSSVKAGPFALPGGCGCLTRADKNVIGSQTSVSAAISERMLTLSGPPDGIQAALSMAWAFIVRSNSDCDGARDAVKAAEAASTHSNLEGVPDEPAENVVV